MVLSVNLDAGCSKAWNFYRGQGHEKVAIVGRDDFGKNQRRISGRKGCCESLLLLSLGAMKEEADDFIPTRAVAVDSFPQTVHVEVVLVLLVLGV